MGFLLSSRGALRVSFTQWGSLLGSGWFASFLSLHPGDFKLDSLVVALIGQLETSILANAHIASQVQVSVEDKVIGLNLAISIILSLSGLLEL